MPIIRTDKWLEKYRKDRKKTLNENLELQNELFCTKLVKYFDGAYNYEIHDYLMDNGLFIPDIEDDNVIKAMIEKDLWIHAARLFKKLRLLWNGPDVPIFIFPANYKNNNLKNDFNGKTGLGFSDKVFLFVSDYTSIKALQALLIHEYSHVCRLNHLNKNENELTLLDSIILEGMAEKAVEELLGEEYLAKWTSLYNENEALLFWKKVIVANGKVEKRNRVHDVLLYGKFRYPKWMGYNVGYHLVSSFIKNTKKKSSDFLRLETEEVLKNSSFYK